MNGCSRTLGSSRLRAVAAAILLVGPGCSREEEEPADEAIEGASTPTVSELQGAREVHPSEPGFYFQPAQVLASPVPTRFRGPLPSTTEQFESGLLAFPPWSYVQARLCRGEQDVGERYLDALDRAIDGGTFYDPVPGYFQSLLPYCRGPQFCAWVRGVGRSEYAAAGRELVLARLELCEGDVSIPRPAFRRARDPKRVSVDDPLFSAAPPVFQAEVQALGTEQAVVRLKHCVLAVGNLDDWTRAACLHRMARLDWAAAAILAAELRDDAAISGVVQTLVAFPEPGQLEHMLESTGLLPDQPDPERVDTLDITLPARLSRYGRLHWFEPGIAGDPGLMEWVLYECAAREPALADAAFEVAWRPADPYADQTEASRTAVFVDGTEYRFELAPFDDLDAVEKIVGLLNTVSSERGSSTRFAPWSVSEDGIGVVMGPGPALQTARDRGLVGYMTP